MEQLHYLLIKSFTMLNRRIVSRVMVNGITPGQPKILECLSKTEGIDQKTIAKLCDIEQTTVGGILLRMEQAGLIERRQKEGNRRSLFVYLTEKGKKAAAGINKVFAEEDSRAEEGFSPEEAARLKELLQKLCDTLDDES